MPTNKDPTTILFELEGLPVYCGDLLHVAPEYHARAGATVLAYREAIDGYAVCRTLGVGAVPTLPVSSLSRQPYQETLDREQIRQQLPFARISDRDLKMWKLGRDAALQTKEIS